MIELGMKCNWLVQNENPETEKHLVVYNDKTFERECDDRESVIWFSIYEALSVRLLRSGKECE